MAPPPPAGEVEEDLLEVGCAGCGETLEVERGLTEFICPDCSTPQALPPELMRRRPRGAAARCPSRRGRGRGRGRRLHLRRLPRRARRGSRAGPAGRCSACRRGCPAAAARSAAPSSPSTPRASASTSSLPPPRRSSRSRCRRSSGPWSGAGTAGLS
ncbi:unnamed protein product [Urochloa humidicola]